VLIGAPKNFDRLINGELAAFRESAEGRVGSLAGSYSPFQLSDDSNKIPIA